MIHFIRFDVVDEVNELARVREIAVMEKESDIRVMRIGVDVVDPPRVEGAGAADKAVDLVALAEQKLSQVTSVLPVIPVISAIAICAPLLPQRMNLSSRLRPNRQKFPIPDFSIGYRLWQLVVVCAGKSRRTCCPQVYSIFDGTGESCQTQ
jgi:hypothetical protein